MYDDSIFNKTTLSDLFESVSVSKKERDLEIKAAIDDVKVKIEEKKISVQQAYEFIKMYLELGIKNDDQMLKIATIAQRIILAELRLKDPEELLPDAEIEKLRESLMNDVDEFSNVAQDIINNKEQDS